MGGVHNVEKMKSDCSCSPCIHKKSTGVNQKQQSTNQKKKKKKKKIISNVYFFLLSWLLLCIKFKGMPVYTNDDAIVFLVVVVSIASNSPFCLERYLLHLPASWNVRIPRYYVTRSQWPCVFKCRLSRVSVFFLFLVCVLFSGPSRLFDDFSGESNDHKQNKIKEKN